MAFVPSLSRSLSRNHLSSSNPIHNVSRRPRTRAITWRCALSAAEQEKKAKLEAEAATARRIAETRAVKAVVEGTATMYADSRYGQCSICDRPVVIPGLSHSLCSNCGWVERPKLPEEVVKLEGHHD